MTHQKCPRRPSRHRKYENSPWICGECGQAWIVRYTATWAGDYDEWVAWPFKEKS